MHLAYSKWSQKLEKYGAPRQEGILHNQTGAPKLTTTQKAMRLLSLARSHEVFLGIVYGGLLLEKFSSEHVVILLSFFGFALIDSANLVSLLS